MHMKNGRNLRRLILFSLAAGCTLGGLVSGDVYADEKPLMNRFCISTKIIR